MDAGPIMSQAELPTDKPADRQAEPKTRPPVKTAVTLSGDASHRLKSAALHEGKTQSELVEMLVLRHLGAYYTSKRAG
jgi:hypothetical protein